MMKLLVVLLCMVGCTWGQAVHCQAGDTDCQKCSSSCSSIAPGDLPLCCEAYNACCDEYFNACKACPSFLNLDPHFPEYCCASFTDCCDLIPSLSSNAITPVRTTANTGGRPSHPGLEIPVTAAPRPVLSFNGVRGGSSNNNAAQGAAVQQPSAGRRPQQSRRRPQTNRATAPAASIAQESSGRPRVSSRGRMSSRGRVQE